MADDGGEGDSDSVPMAESFLSTLGHDTCRMFYDGVLGTANGDNQPRFFVTP